MKKAVATIIVITGVLACLWQSDKRPLISPQRPGHVAADRELEARQERLLIDRLNPLLTEQQIQQHAPSSDDLEYMIHQVEQGDYAAQGRNALRLAIWLTPRRSRFGGGVEQAGFGFYRSNPGTRRASEHAMAERIRMASIRALATWPRRDEFPREDSTWHWREGLFDCLVEFGNEQTAAEVLLLGRDEYGYQIGDYLNTAESILGLSKTPNHGICGNSTWLERRSWARRRDQRLRKRLDEVAQFIDGFSQPDGNADMRIQAILKTYDDQLENLFTEYSSAAEQLEQLIALGPVILPEIRRQLPIESDENRRRFLIYVDASVSGDVPQTAIERGLNRRGDEQRFALQLIKASGTTAYFQSLDRLQNGVNGNLASDLLVSNHSSECMEALTRISEQGAKTEAERFNDQNYTAYHAVNTLEFWTARLQHQDQPGR